MKKSFIVVTILLFFQTIAFPQLLQNSFSSKNNLKIQRGDNNLLISLKTGYHTRYQKDSENGFNDGMIFGADVNATVADEAYLGISFEYWYNKDENNNRYPGISSSTFSGWNFSFNYTKRFRSRNLSSNLGLGVGMYFTNQQDKYYNGKNSYFNLKVIGGMDIRLYDILWISPQMEYNNMFNFVKAIGMFSFKIGPTLILED
ncbi:MAG: hypothetical protein HY959_04940 [Ignavibacteriae bacterium]|nr:hypothetical protein [Ignavibacteriota bacterium]